MPVVTFNAALHEYRVDGRPVLNVTAVLGAAGFGVDYSRVPPGTMELARLRGDYVDRCCDLIDQGDLDWASVHPEMLPYARAWQLFCERERFKSIVSQGIVYHAELDIAGRPDSYGLQDRAPTIVERKAIYIAPAVREETKDKRRKALADAYALQATGYALPGIALALDDSDGELMTLKVDRRLIVGLLPDGEYLVADCELEAKKAGRDDFAAFRGAVAVARWRGTNGNGKR